MTKGGGHVCVISSIYKAPWYMKTLKSSEQLHFLQDE
jgi:hypothetical protein